MIDNKKIEEAAYRFATSQTHGELLALIDGYKEGYKNAINEFLNNLWHPTSEEPKHDKQITYVRVNGIAKTIILNEEADKFNSTPSQIWHNICKNYKVARWLYIDDLFPEEVGEE